MGIRMVEDIGAPLAVTAIDLIVEKTKPEWNTWASYIVAVGSYVGAWMGWGGPFVKNMGIASFPWAAKNIGRQVGFITGTPGQVAYRAVAFKGSGVSRFPAAPFATQFAGAKLV